MGARMVRLSLEKVRPSAGVMRILPLLFTRTVLRIFSPPEPKPACSSTILPSCRSLGCCLAFTLYPKNCEATPT